MHRLNGTAHSCGSIKRFRAGGLQTAFVWQSCFLRCQAGLFAEGKGGVVKLKKPEGNVIIVFEPGDCLYSIVSKLLDDDDYLLHAPDAAVLKSAIEKEANNIAFILASDETEPYDTLEILEVYQNEPWFQGALCSIVSKAYHSEREEKADALGFQDYIDLSAVASTEQERILTTCISRQLRLMKKLQRLKKSANCDGLTGLYNQAAAADVITKMLDNNPKQEFLFAIIDIDYFKQVNDVRGHAFGDKVLKEEATRITQALGEGALAIRYGGDEFILMVPVDSDLTEISRTIYENTHFVLEDYQVTNSIGITETSSADREWECLFRQADQALYTAKANGRNQYCIYTSEMTHKLDGVGEEIRNEVLNLCTSSLIHALVDGCYLACHMDLEKVAVTKLCKTASGEFGWSDPIEYIPFIKNLLDFAEDRCRLRFSEFINPNTLAGRMNATSTLIFFFSGVDGKNYRAEFFAGDKGQNGRIANALLLIKKADNSEKGSLRYDENATEKCMVSGLLQTYHAIWIIHLGTLSRELVNTQTDLSRHRRINRLFEGGDYWDDTRGYFQLYVSEEERESLLHKLHPDVVLHEVEDKGMYTQRFHRTVDGITSLCEYSFINAMYGEEKVILQLYRRLKETEE